MFAWVGTIIPCWQTPTSGGPSSQTTTAFCIIVLIDNPSYSAVNRRRQIVSSRRCPSVEWSAAARYISAVSWHFSVLPEGPPVHSHLWWLFSACAVTLVISDTIILFVTYLPYRRCLKLIENRLIDSRFTVRTKEHSVEAVEESAYFRWRFSCFILVCQ